MVTRFQKWVDVSSTMPMKVVNCFLRLRLGLIQLVVMALLISKRFSVANKLTSGLHEHENSRFHWISLEAT